jgi:negative regulator of sigma E activity
MALLGGYICSMATTLTVLAVLMYGVSGFLVEYSMPKVRQQPHLRPPIVQPTIQGSAATAPISTDVSASEGTDDAQMRKTRRANAERSKRMRQARNETRELLASQREDRGYPIALGFAQEPAYDPRSWH